MSLRVAPHVYSEYLMDGMDGIGVVAWLTEDTAYALKYSDAGFLSVRLGMTDAEVNALVGAPQKSWTISASADGADMGARWSYSPGDTNFRCRVLLFRAHHVIEKHTEFYWD